MSEEKSSNPKAETAKKGPVTILALLALVVALTAAGCSFWVWQTTKQFSRNMSDVISGSDQSLQNAEMSWQTRLTEMLQTIDRHDAMLQKIEQHQQGNNTAWVMDEAEYLTRLAIYHLQFAHDIQTARDLLQAADKRLQVLKDPALLPARQALQDSITKLDALGAPNKETILLKLQALETALAEFNLTVSDALKTASHENEGETVTLPEAGWHKSFGDSMKHLEKLVVIRRHDHPYAALPPIEQKAYLIQSLHVSLDQAKWAVLRDNIELYQGAIDQALKNLSAYHESDSTFAKQFSSELQTLRDTHFSITLPDISHVLTALQETVKHTGKTS